MRPALNAAAQVGRIGALAVALGVGAAVATGQGVASADSAGSGSASGAKSSSSSSSSDSDSKGTAAAGKRKSGKPAAASPSAAAGSATGATANSATTKATTTTEVTPKRVTTKATDAAASTSASVPSTATSTTTSTASATAPAAVEKATATPTLSAAPAVVPQLVSGVLAAVGLASPTANAPVAPAEPPALWTLLAAVRREFDRSFSPLGKSTTSASSTAAAQAAAISTAAAVSTTAANPSYPSSLPSTPVGWVTGVNNPSPGILTPYIPQTNNTSGFNIYGTDLGIMWDNMQSGDTHYILTAFGDTFSGANMSGNWRSNVLLLSTDNKLYNGMALLQTGPAYQFIPGVPSALGFGGSEVTIIPTSGVAVLGNQYVNYMSVKSWDTPGSWTTNYSAVSVYDPTTDKWVLAPSTIRSAGWFRSSTPYVPGSQNFQQAAYVLEPEDQVGADGVRYLYAFGTPSGRQGSAYLSRVAEGSVTDLSQYEYWNGNTGTWVKGNPAVATAVVGSANDTRPIIGGFVDIANDPNFFGGIFGGLLGAKQGGNVSEMSVQYNDYLGKYVMMYGDGNNNVQMRVADTPEGTWSDPIMVASSLQYPGLYAPMIHPWSGTGELTDSAGNPDVSHLYWNMSIWGDYNVVMMQTDLSPLKTTSV
ncbi:DUF4185 domain-containing protein [Mycolicibacterium komossense]|nr:DUF4185 domain-containing protein [Mycolicibacterium komossense]